MIQSRRLELPLRLKNSDLNAARLAIQPPAQRHANSDTYVNSCSSEHTMNSACQYTTYLLVYATPKSQHRVFKREQHVEKRDQCPITDRCKQVDQADYQLRQPTQPENPNHRFTRAAWIGIDWNGWNHARWRLLIHQKWGDQSKQLCLRWYAASSIQLFSKHLDRLRADLKH